MKFSTKVFLSIFIISIILVSGALSWINIKFEKVLTDQFMAHYKGLVKTIGNELKKLKGCLIQ